MPKGPVYIREIETRFKKRRVKNSLGNRPITDPSIIVDIFQHLQDETKEKLLAVALDSRQKILCFEVIAIGSVSSVEARPVEVVRNTLSINPTGYILVHNHPSGNPKPSRDDRKLTRLLEKILTSLGVKLYDHIIIGSAGEYFSFAEEKAVKEAKRT